MNESKSKALASVNPQGEIIGIKNIVLSKVDKAQIISAPIAMAALFPALGGLLAMSDHPVYMWPLIVALSGMVGVAGVVASLENSEDKKAAMLTKALSLDPQSVRHVHMAMQKARKERVMVNEFDILEKKDVVLEKWMEKTDGDSPSDSSHTVKNYLVRSKSGLSVEQEIVPNQETIWDISADALVEVYKVSEPVTRYSFPS